MINRVQKIRFYPDKLDFGIYLGLLLWITIIETLDVSGGWDTYFPCAGALCISQLPVLVFAWKKEDWNRTLTAATYRKYWIICFAVYLPLLAVGSSLMLDGTDIWEVVLSGAVCAFGLEMILLGNHYYARRVSNARWIQRLSLEKAIFISLTFIALVLAAMAVSSLGNPLYHKKEQLLIGFEFDPIKVFSNFGTFLSYAGQLLLMYLSGYFLFLINSRILVRGVLKKKGILLYLLGTMAVVGIFYPFLGQMLAALPFGKQLGGVFSQNPFVLENAFGAVNVLLVSLPVLLAINWSRQNTLIVALEKEKAQAELDLLRQQLNPHFFFNTLNNLYALSLQRSQETPEVILQLSDLMRYVIYKAREPYVMIGDEVRYLQDYLQLQSIRLKGKLDLSFELDIRDETFRIAPLLLIVFIENAFKHGIEPVGNGFLQISLKTVDRKLYFTCRNAFEPEAQHGTGIGLANLQKRLHLLYPGKHRLYIKNESPVFRAELELENDAMPDR